MEALAADLNFLVRHLNYQDNLSYGAPNGSVAQVFTKQCSDMAQTAFLCATPYQVGTSERMSREVQDFAQFFVSP